jgi:mannose-1-phosphate guanylyltransferase
MTSRYAVIMAGGVGSRFWPSSTEARPKQFLDILGVGKSFLQLTYDRLLPIIPKENIIIVTNKAYKGLVAEHLPKLPKNNILCEPSRNNTAPCIAYAMYHIKARTGSEASFTVLPADHIILKEEEFRSHLVEAFEACEQNDSIVTLGIKPTRPDTGYGYIHLTMSESNVKKVVEFKEKPDIVTANEYLASDKYVWNAGIFTWKISTLESAFAEHYPQITEVLNQNPEAYNTPQEQSYVDEVYPKTDALSIDYAIMEKADNVYNIVADIGWSDLGTWDSLYDYGKKDANNNFAQGGETILEEVENSIVKTLVNKRTVIRGLDNFIVVDDEDGLLIYPKDKEQEIKNTIKRFSK